MLSFERRAREWRNVNTYLEGIEGFIYGLLCKGALTPTLGGVFL